MGAHPLTPQQVTSVGVHRRTGVQRIDNGTEQEVVEPERSNEKVSTVQGSGSLFA